MHKAYWPASETILEIQFQMDVTFCHTPLVSRGELYLPLLVVLQKLPFRMSINTIYLLNSKLICNFI